MKTGTHEMRNQLAVAVANIEAFIDGKLEATPQRLRAVLQALGEIDTVIDAVNERQGEAMPNEPQIVDICTIISNEVVAIEAATPEAESRVGQVVKNLLLNAFRYAAPGSAVALDCHHELHKFAFSVSNKNAGGARDAGKPELCLATQSHSGMITVESRSGNGAIFTVRLADGMLALPVAARAVKAPLILVAPIADLR